MKKSYLSLVVLVLLCSASFHANAQLIINKYAAVTGYIACSNALAVDVATDFNVGDTVLMIQMKGATIDTSNTSSFGNVLNYNGAGNYEYNVVQGISGNAISLKYIIVRAYNIPDGKVQLVKVPSFESYTIAQPHSCMAWNGSKGGVFAVYVQNALTLNDDILLDEKGFKGGINNQTPTNVGPVICSNTNFYGAPDYDLASMKGEGIAEVPLSKSYGRGKLANGGGGGNAHNAGGGGGGNTTAGGAGGNEYTGCTSNPALTTTAGIGGVALLYNNANNKVFLGGGGGSAQCNNLTVSNGGHGGGLCIITAGSIAGNNRMISANGKNASQCVNNNSFGSCHDGSAGGGAGGTILLNTGTITGTLNVQAKGGKGGDEAASISYGEVGPGGGGSGGVLWVKTAATPAGIASSLIGGVNGVILANNSNWGAMPGQPGQTIQNLALNFPVGIFSSNEVQADFSFTRASCFTFNFLDQSVVTSGNPATWSWDFSNPPTSGIQNPMHTFPAYGIYNVTLTVTNSNGCSGSVTKQVDIPYVPFAEAGADVNTCTNIPGMLNASGGVAYAWSPSSGLGNPNAASTSVTTTQNVTYMVTVTNNIGCTDSDSVTVNIVPGPELDIVSGSNSVSCDNKSVRLNVTGADSYNWSPAAYCDDPTAASPMVNPPATTTFIVTGTNANGCSSTDSITIYQALGATQMFMPNAFSPNGDGLNDLVGPKVLCDFTLDVFAIFNRWGQRVFFTTNPDKGWDGFYMDKYVETGVYYYYITGKRNNGDMVKYKGDITLIR